MNLHAIEPTRSSRQRRVGRLKFISTQDGAPRFEALELLAARRAGILERERRQQRRLLRNRF
jgi:hypothetical protein